MRRLMPKRAGEPRWPGESPTAREVLLYFCAGLGSLVLVGILCFFNWRLAVRGDADFLGLYTGAALAGTPGMYSHEANRQVQLARAGFTFESVRYIRLPFYAAALKPLAYLPYRAAYGLFQALSFAAAIVFVILTPGSWRLKAAIAVFLPLALGFVRGQDITFIIAICAVAVLLHRSGRDVAAGFVLSLCLLKFHLFVLVPLALIRHRKWRMIGGAAAGVVLWLAVSTLVAGRDWPTQYLSMVLDPAVFPDLDQMTNLRGLFAGSPFGMYAAVLASAVFLYAIIRLRDFEAAFGIALAGGLLLNTHSYVPDCVFLLPALVSAIQYGNPAARGLALFLLTPIPYLLVLLGHAGLLLVCVAALAVVRATGVSIPSGGLCAG